MHCKLSLLLGHIRMPTQQLSWLNSLPPGQTRNRAVQSVMSSLASREPEKAAEIALRFPPSFLREEAIGEVARSWARKDARAALTWTTELPKSEG